MKVKKYFFPACILLILICFHSNLCAQDTIQKTNGEFIFGKIVEITTKVVSYKKTGNEDGPSYSVELKTVANIRYKSGIKEEYKKSKLVATTHYNASSNIPKTNTNSTDPEKTPSRNNPVTTNPPIPTQTPDNNSPLKNGPVSNQYRIEHLDKRFTINGQKVSQNAVDKLLAKSTNPTVVTIARTAKITKTFQKITKITSFATTAGGGVATIATFSKVYNEVRSGGASTQAYVNAGLSFLGTMALPITSKILKSKRDKLYDKAIDLYNVAN